MNKIWTPQISLPDILAADPRFAAARNALEPHLAHLSSASLECLFLPRIDILPEHVLDILAAQYHVDFYEPLGMSVDVKRSFIRNAILWHRIKGTPVAVETVLERAFAIARVEEWFQYQGEPYFFRIHIDITSDDEDTDRDTLNRLRKAVAESKNARSWLEFYNFRLDSADSVDHSDEHHIIATPELFDRYDFRRVAPSYDGAFFYDGATVYGGFEHEEFEEVSTWELGLAHADNASVGVQIALHASIAPWHDTFPVQDDYAAVPHLAHAETINAVENISADVALNAADREDVTIELRAEVHMTALDSIAPFDDAEARLTQVFRYDGVFDYGGSIDYSGTVEGGTIFITDDEDQHQWALLQRELERDFDEPCTCGASDYEWWYSSIRLGEERFLLYDPQLVTLLIKCKQCGNVIAEYIVPNDQWEVRI